MIDPGNYPDRSQPLGWTGCAMILGMIPWVAIFVWVMLGSPRP